VLFGNVLFKGQLSCVHDFALLNPGRH
jgi:hypothetical protein